VYNRKKNLTKKLKFHTADLPNDWNYGVELARQLDLVRKTRRPIKCKVDPEFEIKLWVANCLPEWQTIWKKKKVEIKWHGGYRAFFLRYIK
jgi:hypothetical protein